MKVQLNLDSTEDAKQLKAVIAALNGDSVEVIQLKKTSPAKEKDAVETGDNDDVITDEDLRSATKPAREAGKDKEMKALLEKFKVKNLTAIPQEKRAAFVKAAKAIA